MSYKFQAFKESVNNSLLYFEKSFEILESAVFEGDLGFRLLI